MTQSASSESTASRSVVAVTPVAASPHRSPASTPSFASSYTSTPTSSRFGCRITSRSARCPVLPVAHCTTRWRGGLMDGTSRGGDVRVATWTSRSASKLAVRLPSRRVTAAETYTAAQARIIAAALALFADHGVSGTSLQMIADEIGVTKAAVYHQFPTKDEIVLAAAEAELARLEAALDAAEAQATATDAREVLVTRIVDLAVERRRSVSIILSDPVIVPFLAAHEPFRRVTERLNRLLLGDDSGPEARVRTAMLMAAISGAGTHPMIVDLDDETLRRELLHLARRFLDLAE